MIAIPSRIIARAVTKALSIRLRRCRADYVIAAAKGAIGQSRSWHPSLRPAPCDDGQEIVGFQACATHKNAVDAGGLQDFRGVGWFY
jgi:hypothetical protein